MPKQKAIIISIKPEWIKLIFAGKKSVELRRSFTQKVEAGTKAVIYSSAPTSAIVGVATIEKIDFSSPKQLWDRYSQSSMATQDQFFNYFKGKDIGVALSLQNVKSTPSTPLDILRKKHKFYPPVSWRFLKDTEYHLLSENAQE